MKRAAGVLMPIFSLPSKYGIGCFDGEAYKFVDWLKEAGQTYWQILPLVPTSYGDSPYQSFSTYAGNPYFISLDALIEEGVLTREECDAVDFGKVESDIDYAKLYNNRYPLLRKAYQRSHIADNTEFQRFLAENHWWLNDYALFMAVKDRFNGKSWTEWAEDIKLRYGYAIMYYNEELYFDIEFHKYLQFKFAQQWKALKDYANKNGVKIIGDIPIYVAMDSADTWANPELFQLDEHNLPTAVAGCPPDGFSPTGQLWGNPLYRWDYHEKTEYQWWMTRLWYSFQMYDVVRIDHFRGFDEYYSIPYGEKTAVKGKWEKGPGMKLFKRMNDYLGERPVIAEDLGFMTDSVRQMVKDSGFPSMKVLEFAFDARDASSSDYLPHRIEKNSVVYTGTHDNETIRGWFDSITAGEMDLARAYLYDDKTPLDELHLSMVALAMRSNADTCIIPIQDYMGKDNTARINTPSTVGQNWRWRAVDGEITPAMAKKIYKMTWAFSRLSDVAVKAAKKAAEEAAAKEKADKKDKVKK